MPLGLAHAHTSFNSNSLDLFVSKENFLYNYLNGSDHTVIASYSGLHDNCLISTTTCSHQSAILKLITFTDWTVRCKQFREALLPNRQHINGYGMGGTLICSPHIPHVIQNSWQSLCDLSHSGNYISEYSDHIST